ncbi:hypothetical protein [Burkholderia aenigmatica]|uniref:hypothetical protein n=1 Tax=Burkholderia aenigmatica TaxID=2015348 RepID=UPI00264CB366|nr:hypothetical protein [Burkholderia aenigmatica]MDN7880065.1 hypothetical protein [Burkholderia aenigmatica]
MSGYDVAVMVAIAVLAFSSGVLLILLLRSNQLLSSMSPMLYIADKIARMAEAMTRATSARQN